MKYLKAMLIICSSLSPSTRREWIEIAPFTLQIVLSASPSTRREWIEIAITKDVAVNEISLPPHGGSGLK